ncbi:hypothetical protein Hamer_G022891 [Homarus americanus]|uniref:Uncharacterized protein n=1 Tax=Homarus americanus TaxID=6706 RepID=A0A8J5THS6_HOMAM|nr:hypothetical protein Hamer_G022891 [Homarus americanus]
MGPKQLTVEEKALGEKNVPIVEIGRRTCRSNATVMLLLVATWDLPPSTVPMQKVRRESPSPQRRTSPATDRLLKNTLLKNP